MQLCPCQCRCQRTARPLFTIAQDKSPTLCAEHHAAVRSPFADPFEIQRIGGACTRIWPVGSLPFDPPRSLTRWSLAPLPEALGQGCAFRHELSISRAAMPASRILGPSAHQIGPSPSQTATGVQMKAMLEATTWKFITFTLIPGLIRTCMRVHYQPVGGPPAFYSPYGLGEVGK